MIWATIILYVASWVLTQIFTPKPDSENVRKQKLTGIKQPTADAGSPISYIFGTVLLAPNVIWYGNFTSVPIYDKVDKKFWPDDEVLVAYGYYISLDLGLCLGPGAILQKIFIKGVSAFAISSGNHANVHIRYQGLFGGRKKGGGFSADGTFYSGEFTETADPSLINLIGPDVPAYVGVSHIVFPDTYMGTNPQLEEMLFLMSRFPDNLGLGISRIMDAGRELNPMEVVYSILTEGWGGLGISAASIDITSFQAAAATLLSENNGMSLEIKSKIGAKQAVAEVLRQVDGALYQDPITGKITIQLVRKDYTVGALQLFDETNADIELWSRTDWSETINQVRVEYQDRSKKYQPAVAFVHDAANIASQGKVNDTTISFPGVASSTLANKLAVRELSQYSVPLFHAKLHLKRNASTLHPGSLIRFSWSDYGVTDVVFRITKPDLGALVDGRVLVDVVQDKFSVSTPLFSDPTDTSWVQTVYTAISPTNFALFETPYYFVNKALVGTAVPADQSWLTCLAQATNQQVGYNVYTSEDVFVNDIVTDIAYAGYVPLAVPGTLFGASHASVLLPRQGMRGTLTKMQVTGSPFYMNQFLGTYSAASIKASGFGLFVMGTEIMAYESFTVLDATLGVYELNNVHRALLDTQPGSYGITSPLYFLTNTKGMSKHYRPDTTVLKVKIGSFTMADEQELSTMTTVDLTMVQRYDSPYPPDFVTIATIRAPQEVIATSSLVLAWSLRSRLTPTTIVFTNDAAGTDEAGTTYTARFILNGITMSSLTSGGSVPTLTLSTFNDNGAALSGVGAGRVEVVSIRAGLTSLYPEFSEFWYGNYPNLTTERLANPNFEGSLASWTTVTGTWAFETTAHPLDAFRSIPGYTTDTRNLRSTGTTNELRQDYTILGGEVGHSAFVSAWKGGKTNAFATGQLIVELRDGGGALTTITTPLAAVTDLSVWERLEIPLPLRTDATTVRVRVVAPAAESVWDNISLRINTASPTTATKYDALGGITVRGAWGLRKMVSTYAGSLVRVIDTFDSTEQDVGFDVDGNLSPFFTRGPARVAKLYDQSGNGSDLIPVAAGQEPYLMNMFTECGRPAIQFRLNNALRDINAASLTRPYMQTRPNVHACLGPIQRAFGSTAHVSIFTIPLQDASTAASRWGVNSNRIGTGTGDWRIQLNGVQTVTAGNASSDGAVKCSIWVDYITGDIYQNSDTPAVATFAAADVTYPNNTRLRIGNVPTGTLDFENGTFYELCIFTGTISAADRKTMMESAALYWFNLAV